MLPHHSYVWQEAVEEGNLRLKRVTTDILMAEPTTMSQVKVGVIGENQDTLKVSIKLPQTFLNPRRTAVRVADMGGVARADIPNVINRALALTRVNAHKDTLVEYAHKNDGDKYEFEIKLPVKVDRTFTARDDYGVEGRGVPLTIATYQHEDPLMQAANQYVFILHVEMTAAERPHAGMCSPGNFTTFHEFA